MHVWYKKNQWPWAWPWHKVTKVHTSLKTSYLLFYARFLHSVCRFWNLVSGQNFFCHAFFLCGRSVHDRFYNMYFSNFAPLPFYSKSEFVNLKEIFYQLIWFLSPHYYSQGFQNSFQIRFNYDGCRVTAAILDFTTISYQNWWFFQNCITAQ